MHGRLLRTRSVLNTAMRVGLAVLWTAFALACESPLSQAGCAWLAVVELYGASRMPRLVHARNWRQAQGEEIRLMAWMTAPGIAAALAGWMSVAPEQWLDALAVASFWGGICFAMWPHAPRRCATQA